MLRVLMRCAPVLPRQRRWCTLSHLLGEHLASKHRWPKTDGLAARRIYECMKERGLRDGNAWRAALDKVVATLVADGYTIGRKANGAALASCPDYTAGRAWLRDRGSWHPSYWNELLQLCIRTEQMDACQDVVHEMVAAEETGRTTTGHSLAELDKRAHATVVVEHAAAQLSKAGRFDELHRLVEHVKSGTHLRLPPRMFCALVRACRTYQQLRSVMDKGHVWRMRGREVGEAVVEVALVLEDKRCTELVDWLLRGDYGTPDLVPWKKASPTDTIPSGVTRGTTVPPLLPSGPGNHGAAERISRHARVQAVDPDMLPADAADEILADIHAALPKASRRPLWSSVWGGAIRLHTILGDHAAALALYDKLRASHIELDRRCRKQLLYAAGVGLHGPSSSLYRRGYFRMAHVAQDGAPEIARLYHAALRGSLKKHQMSSAAVHQRKRVGNSVDRLDVDG